MLEDDKNILNEDGLIRFIHPDQIIHDENTGEHRPSSAAFSMSSSDGCLSVDLEKLLHIDGLQSCHNLQFRANGTGAVRLIAGLVRQNDLGVFHDPIDEAAAGLANPYHGQVFNKKNHGSISKSAKRSLVKGSFWLHLPIDEDN